MALVFVILNPEAGRDYDSYLRIINDIKDGVWYKEIGFSLFVKLLLSLGFSPEIIMLIFRAIFFYFILRFFYFTAFNYKILGVIFLHLYQISLLDRSMHYKHGFRLLFFYKPLQVKIKIILIKES